MNVLSKILDKAGKDKRIGYHPYCQNIGLTHLCFADDLLVFSDGTKRSIEGILEIFTEFACASGLKISLEKSTIYMAGVTDAAKQSILEQFPFDTGTLPVRYLGLPLLTKMMTVNDYTPLLEKIRNRISSWTARYLSFAGRLQLISSVIQSLTNFWMSAFRLPKSCLREIDKICAAFLWSGPELNPRKAKIAWTEVCKPKEEGGLGLRPLLLANKVSCLKLIWRILSGKSLWVDWINHYLIRKGCLWSFKVTSSLGSWMWKKLLKYRDLAANLTKVDVHCGSSTSFWYDYWSPLGRLIDIAGLRGCIDLGIPVDSTVDRVLATHRKRRHRVEALNNIEAAIETLRQRGVSTRADVVLWRQKDDKFRAKFNTKQTVTLIREAQPICNWYKGIWFTYATPKFSFISWLAMHNRLSTGDRMLSWNIGVSGACVFCGDLESRNHLFFSCTYSAEVWSGLTRNLLGARYTTQWQEIIELLLDSDSDIIASFLRRYVFIVSVYWIWRERNGRLHGEIPMPSGRMKQSIDKQIRNRLTSIRSMGDVRYENGMQTWFACL